MPLKKAAYRGKGGILQQELTELGMLVVVDQLSILHIL